MLCMDGLLVDYGSHLRQLLEATVIVLNPDPLTILDAVLFRRLGIHENARLRM